MALFFLIMTPLDLARADVSGAWGVWQDARSLYDAGRYQEALLAMLSRPEPDNPNYCYNLGNLHYRLGKRGVALAWYERANRQNPRDPMIQRNIRLVREQLSGVLGADRLDPASDAIEILADRLPIDEVRASLGLLGLLLSLVWLRSFLKTRQLKVTLTGAASILVGSGFLITAGLYGIQRYSERHPPAIVLDSQVVRSGPGERFLELGRVEAGVKLRVTGPISSAGETPSEVWRQVRYSQGGIGWVRDASLLLLFQ